MVSTQTVSNGHLVHHPQVIHTVQVNFLMLGLEKLKRRYKQAFKSNFTHGIAKLDHQERVLHDRRTADPEGYEVLPPTAPDICHQMSFHTKDRLELLEKRTLLASCKVSPMVELWQV